MTTTMSLAQRLNALESPAPKVRKPAKAKAAKVTIVLDAECLRDCFDSTTERLALCITLGITEAIAEGARRIRKTNRAKTRRLLQQAMATQDARRVAAIVEALDALV
jgi:hypothetical protein